MRTLISLLAALALVAAPVAMAAAGGKSADHANEKAAGPSKAADARANATHDADDDDADADGANVTKEKDENHTAPAGNAWGYWWKQAIADWKNATKSGLKPWHSDATAKSHANHTDADDAKNGTHEPKRAGWAKAMANVPSKVRTFFERVLAGATPRDAHGEA